MTQRRKKAGHAVYFQQSNPARIQDEFALVRAATVREEFLVRLSTLIHDVNLQQRENNDACILETFTLLNQLRESTLNISDAIEVWQQAFTKVVSPQLFGTDYITGMIKRQEFLITLKIRKIFNFNISTGNILMLPIASGGIQSKNSGCTSDLIDQMELYASPSAERIKRFYSMLEKFLPPKIFRLVLPLQTWVQNPWKAPTSPPQILPKSFPSITASLSTSRSRSNLQRLKGVISATAAFRTATASAAVAAATTVTTTITSVTLEERENQIDDIDKSKEEGSLPATMALATLQEKKVTIETLEASEEKSLNIPIESLSISSADMLSSSSSSITQLDILPITSHITVEMETRKTTAKSKKSRKIGDDIDDSYIQAMQHLFLSNAKSKGTRISKDNVKIS